MTCVPQQTNKRYRQRNAKDKSRAASPDSSMLSTYKRADDASC